MFVGYEIKSNFGSAKPVVLETDIKLSQAVLDPSGKGNNKKEPVCLMAEYNKKQFILAVLDPNQSWQCPLDLMFAAGSEVKFFLRGTGSVHLTGFEYRDDSDDFEMSMSSDDEDVSEDEDQVVVQKAKAKAKALSPKTNGVKLNGKKDAGKKLGIKGDQPDSDDDDDDEDDEDFNDSVEDDDDSDLEISGEDSSGGEDEEMDDSDTLGHLDVEDSDADSDEDEESD